MRALPPLFFSADRLAPVMSLSPGFEILFEDAACLVVGKPGGLLTQAPLGIDSLEFRIRKYLRESGTAPGATGAANAASSPAIYLGVPHRIDRPVSGVIVFAKTQKAARKISQQFEFRMVEKTYWALVAGEVQPDQGTWTDYLLKIDGEPRTIVTPPETPESKIAILHYTVKCRLPGKTLIEIRLETGRTHQIRVQCASRGFPLLGDELYGSTQSFGPFFPDERDRLISLHARQLVFQHPTSKELLSFEASLGPAWGEAGISESMVVPSSDPLKT